ncbi:hypothetical protein SAMN02799632_00640 [Acinetobacter pittii]|jgi:hypothetical protein|uniref:hypothetical protein n=1 Tax=Acinetobacter TaxID=469 RepID=UPI000448074D|nr:MULTISPECIES: hypothetical protein [Acinetobacter]EXE89423.1 hypothetical protein J588_2917 [Acinetobacter sp. 1578804]EXR41841.1 hypothetical protein J655_2235 [Acinetobacter sp. 1294243]KCX16549.1 hypothetical protein J723_1378 [Acinetobacter sp. 1264765]KQE18118.1 hypothetical protein APD38_00525 [Acinetobacter pittii]KQE27409.1 hypothetical protein APD39_15870 [Acinetobacter pittii]
MQRLFLISALCAGLFTGCATTSKLIPLVGSETPMQQVLKAQPEIVKEHNNTSVQQVFNRVESPTVSRITVIQTGLMDDSVSAIRTEYSFKLVDEKWQLQNKQKSYQCARGKGSKGFQTQLCS